MALLRSLGRLSTVRLQPLHGCGGACGPQVPLLQDGEVALVKRYRGRREVGFALCRARDGRLVHGPVSVGTPTSVDITVSCPAGSELVGLFHTHPGGVPVPSEQDIRSALQVGAKVLCIDADGDLRCWRVLGRR